jgi:hypothetical protein
LYFSACVITLKQARDIVWVGNVTPMTDVRGDKFMNLGLKNLKRKNHLEDLDGDGRTKLKRPNKQRVNFLLGSDQGPMSGFCRHCNEH